MEHTRTSLLITCAAILGVVAGSVSSGVSSAAPAPMLVHPAIEGPQPQHFFNLAYCGSGRVDDAASGLHAFDWSAAAANYSVTIVPHFGGGYRDFARSIRRHSPEHALLLYLHIHGLDPASDRAGALNLHETNYLHGTDPASLELTPLPEGVLIDWTADERAKYDEYGIISPAREFAVGGYIIERASEDGEAERLASLPATVTAFVDSTVQRGGRYTYRVLTVGGLGHLMPFSHDAEVVLEEASSTPPLVVRDHQRAIGSAVDRDVYPFRVRIRTGGAVSAARLLVDLNVDRDFDDTGEVITMSDLGGGAFEGSAELDVGARAFAGAHHVIGFPYRLEVAGDGETLTLPRRGSFTTSVNNRVRNRRFGFYLMRPGSDYWLEYLVRRVKHRAGASREVGGIFVDELVVDLRYVADADPVELTSPALQRESVELLGRLSSRYPHLRLFYNGVGEGVDPIECEGGMIEGFCLARWFRGGGSEPGFIEPWRWEQQLNSGLDMARRDRSAFFLARDFPIEHLRARLFALASFHLIRWEEGRFCYLPGRCAGRPLPEWKIDLGAPRETFEEIAEARRGDASLYARSFENGEVWVNADQRGSRVVELDRPGLLVELAGTVSDGNGEETGDGDGTGNGAGDGNGAGGGSDHVLVARRVESFDLKAQSGAIVLWPSAERPESEQ